MLRPGKLPPDLLRPLLGSIRIADPAVLVAGAVGEDAAVIDTGGEDLLVAKTDPITFAAEDMGRYLLAVNGNDLATCGAEPRWLLVTALLPEGVSGERAVSLLENVRKACEAAGVALVGGHTEITPGLNRPILVGCLLGTVPRHRLMRTAGARPGDAILLTGGIAVEGTAILAREHGALLAARGVEAGVIGRAAAWLGDPGISVLPAARAAWSAVPVHAMHDPTEGGLVAALHELAEAAGAGLRVERGAIPILEECASICAALELDPLRLLASGALLIVTAEPDADAVPGAVRIGTMLGPGEGCWLDGDPLPEPTCDELARFLASLPAADQALEDEARRNK